LPELPSARRDRYQASLGLSAYDATVLVGEPEAVRLFEATIAADATLDPKQVANWVTGDFLRLRNQAAGPIEVAPAELAALIRLVGDGSISRANAKEVLDPTLPAGTRRPRSSRREGSGRSRTWARLARRSTR
jgi:aspartyl-tRNA(Asn)/glutamyl-tRNA(Gln) amidotransferase subunit B